MTYLTLLPPPNNNVDANRVSSLKQDDPEIPHRVPQFSRRNQFIPVTMNAFKASISSSSVSFFFLDRVEHTWNQ